MIDLYLLSVILFFLIIGILIYRDRKKVEFKTILVMRRTKRFRNFINRLAKPKRFWKILASIGIIVCFFFMFYGMFSLISVVKDILTGEITQPVLHFIFPTPSAQVATGPGYILIPFWFWIIAVASILIPHELFHGIIARAEKVPLKSVGLLLLLIFPGAFVEPDEKKLKKRKTLTKLRIFAAGSFANFIVAGLLLLSLNYVIVPASFDQGIYLFNVTKDSPADIAGLKPNMSVSEINGKTIRVSYIEYISRNYLLEELGNAKPNDTITVKAEDNIYDVTLGGNETAYMGIVYHPNFKLSPDILFPLISLLTMVWFFSLAIGIVNILPLYPLDGGLMVEAVAEKFNKKKAKKITRFITFLTLSILIFDFIGPFLV